MGFAGFLLRVFGTVLGISIHLVAFLVGNWLTRILVFSIVAFGKPEGLRGRLNGRCQRVQERFGNVRVRFARL